MAPESEPNGVVFCCAFFGGRGIECKRADKNVIVSFFIFNRQSRRLEFTENAVVKMSNRALYTANYSAYAFNSNEKREQ